MKQASLILLFLAFMAGCSEEYLYYPRGGGWGPMMYYGYGGMFMWILFLIIAGLLAYFIIKGMRKKGQMPTQNENALDILKKRYARGEITKEDFDRMKRDIS